MKADTEKKKKKNTKSDHFSPSFIYFFTVVSLSCTVIDLNLMQVTLS